MIKFKCVIPAKAGIFRRYWYWWIDKIPAYAGMTIIGLTLLLSTSAFATPLVADLSNYRIDIDSRFNGTRIFLFGARNDNGDIVVVVRGPSKNYIVRRKEEVAGIWVNRDRMRLFDVPDFYTVASSR